MKKIIPKEFELAGQKIKVSKAKDIKVDGAVGVARFYTNEIRVRTEVSSEPISQDAMDHHYCHELSHWLTYIAGYEELCADENFQDRMGHMLHQYLKTVKY